MSTPSLHLYIPLAAPLANRANGAVGESREARFARARERKQLRSLVFTVATSLPEWKREIGGWAMRGGKPPRAAPLMRADSWLTGPLTLTLTRIAPGAGRAGKLDEHDGLRHAFKSVVDAITDALGRRVDRDPCLTWLYRQSTGSPAIDVLVEPRAACSCGESLEPRWRGCPMCLRAKGAA